MHKPQAPKRFVEITARLEELRDDMKYYLKDEDFAADSHHIVELAKIYVLYFEGTKLASQVQRKLIQKMA